MSDESLKSLHPNVAHAVTTYGLESKIVPCDPELADTAAFCDHYGFLPSQSANTIIVALKGNPESFVCCIVLATQKLDVNKKVRSLTEKKGSFASAEQTKTLTSMEIGGVTAIGIEDMPMYVDQSVFENTEIVMGGGNRSTKLLLNPNELKKLPNLQIIDSLGIPR